MGNSNQIDQNIYLILLTVFDYSSVAIVRYISREFKVDDHWYPADSKCQAKVDEYLEWQHLNTRLYCATYFIVKVMLILCAFYIPGCLNNSLLH